MSGAFKHGSRAAVVVEEGGDTLLFPSDLNKRASEASTSPSGELWDELGGFPSAIRAERTK